MSEDKRVFVKATATASWYKMGDIIQVLPEKSGRYFKPVNDQNQYIREDDCEICDQPQQKEQFSREDMIGFGRFFTDLCNSKEMYLKIKAKYPDIKLTDDLLLTEYLNSKTKPI